MHRGANWLAWTLHGLLGLLVGGSIGWWWAVRTLDNLAIQKDLALVFIMAGALLGAGLGARYGDRLWIGDNYHMIPPDEPEQSHLSDWVAWVLIAAGLATAVVALLIQSGIL